MDNALEVAERAKTKRECLETLVEYQMPIKRQPLWNQQLAFVALDWPDHVIEGMSCRKHSSKKNQKRCIQSVISFAAAAADNHSRKLY